MEITDFHNRHKGETCFVLGNGPSLNDIDLKALPYPTFGSNRIYLSGYTPTYYSCVNPLVLDQFGDEIFVQTEKSVRFFNYPYCNNIGGYKIDTSESAPVFGDCTIPIWEGHTVTYVLLQLAFLMGFKKVILLGVDHDYGDKGANPNAELVATGPDPYHFSPEYFSQGARWHAPDLTMSELAYSLAKLVYESNDRKIVNASTRTKLRVFPLESLSRALRQDPPRVSAIVSAYKCSSDWLRDCIYDIDMQVEIAEPIVVCQENSEQHKVVRDYTHLKVVTTKDIPTVYKAWNLGIKVASGKYLTNCNTDDRRHPLSMVTMADVLDARPDLDVVYHDQYITWGEPKFYQEFMNDLVESGEQLVPGRFEGKPGAFMWNDHDLRVLSQGCYVGPQPMWRASLHQVKGYFLETYKSAGDYEFWLRVATEKNMFHIGAAMGVYCARLDGVELGGPKLSADESSRAQMINQDPDGVGYTPMGGYIKIELGGKYSFVDASLFFQTIDRLRSNYVSKE